MREYIITDKQLKTVTEAYLEHELSRPITDVFISGDKLPEIVRCRDCVFFTADVSTVDERGEQIATGNLCEWTELWTEPDGFCAWGERANFATCKCGEDVELGNRESAVCPSCGRMVIA